MNSDTARLGACHSLANASRLLDDAVLLYMAGRIPSSFHMAVMAREELGRFNILSQIAQEIADGATITAADVRYRVKPTQKSHQAKLQSGQSTFFTNVPLPTESFLERQTRYTEMRKTDSNELHIKRLAAQYVDLKADETWSTPSETMESDAQALIWTVAAEIGDSLRWVESDDDCKGSLSEGDISLPRPEDFLARSLVMRSADVAAQQHAPPGRA